MAGLGGLILKSYVSISEQSLHVSVRSVPIKKYNTADRDKTVDQGLVSVFDKIREALKGKAELPAPVVERKQADVPMVTPFSDVASEVSGDRKQSPDIVKGDIDHSGHMRILARNDGDASKLGIDALAGSRNRMTVRYGQDDISGYLSGNGVLEIMTITKNGETLAAFPVSLAGRPNTARVTQVIECNNTYEGQVEAFLNGGTTTFFDVLYFRNRNTYFPGKDVRILLTGIAYVLSRSRPASDKKQGDDDILVRYENGDIDDYVFRGIVQGVKDVTAFGKRAVVMKTEARTGHDAKPVELYVCATENAITEKINPGDRITGIIWLQGFMVN